MIVVLSSFNILDLTVVFVFGGALGGGGGGGGALGGGGGGGALGGGGGALGGGWKFVRRVATGLELMILIIVFSLLIMIFLLFEVVFDLCFLHMVLPFLVYDVIPGGHWLFIDILLTFKKNPVSLWD